MQLSQASPGLKLFTLSSLASVLGSRTRVAIPDQVEQRGVRPFPAPEGLAWLAAGCWLSGHGQDTGSHQGDRKCR